MSSVPGKGGNPITPGSKYDICDTGPVARRKCTDVLFFFLFIAHIIAFWVCSGYGFKFGDPEKLIVGQDWQGSFCGLSSHLIYALDYGTNTPSKDYPALIYTMNVSAVATGLLGNTFGSGVTDLAPSSMLASGQLTKIISSFSGYTYGSCVTSCNAATSATADVMRFYQWEGPSDAAGHASWTSFVASATALEMQAFNFSALPFSICPYDAKYCVLFPSQVTYQSLLGYYCVPGAPVLNSANVSIGALIPNGFGSSAVSGFGPMMGDLKTSWKATVITAFASLGIALICLILLRYFIGVLVWLSIFALFLILIAAAVTMLLYADKCAGQSLLTTAETFAESSSNMAAYLKGAATCSAGFAIPDESNRIALRVMSYVIFGIAGLYVIIILLMFKRLRIAIAINKVAAQFVGHNLELILLPISQVITSVVWWVVWVICILFVLTYIPANVLDFSRTFTSYSAAHAYCSPTTTVFTVSTDYIASPPSSVYACMPLRHYAGGMFGYMVFSLFWMNAFIVDYGQMAIAGAVGVWYFTPNDAKSKLHFKPMRMGVWNALRYHLGTLAFGSLILAIAQYVKFVLSYMRAQASKTGNRVLAIVAGVLACCVGCIEKLIKFLNKNAYIQSALMGTNFCTSAKNAFLLVIRNALRIATLASLSGIVNFVCVVFIAGATGALGWLIVTEMYEGQITSPIMPVALYVIIGFIVGKLVMNVFHLGVDSILQCFVIDEEINTQKGSLSRCTPSSLVTFMENHKPAPPKA